MLPEVEVTARASREDWTKFKEYFTALMDGEELEPDEREFMNNFKTSFFSAINNA